MSISAGQQVIIDARGRVGAYTVRAVNEVSKSVRNIALADPNNPRRILHIGPESIVGFSKAEEKRKVALNGGSKIILGIATRIKREEHVRRLMALSAHHGNVHDAAASIGMEYQTLFGYAQRFAKGGAKAALAALNQEAVA